METLKNLTFSIVLILVGAILIILGLSGGATIENNSLLIQGFWDKKISLGVGVFLLAVAIYMEVNKQKLHASLLRETINTTTFSTGREALERVLNPESDTYKSFVHDIPTNKATDPELEKALEALSIGHITEALEMLTDLSKKDPAYQPQLLSGLLVSKRPEDWERAEKLLPKYGTPEQYGRLSMNFWSIKNLDKAISLAENAREQVDSLVKKGVSVEPIVVSKIKNNLAYYYADALKKDKADKAKELAQDAVALARQIMDGEGPLQHAKSLDTLGFVKISFGATREEIEEGMKDCEDARRLGGDQEFYFKHIEHARKRLPLESVA